MGTFTIMIQNNNNKTVYQQVIDSDSGLVKAVIQAVITYKPKQVRDLEEIKYRASVGRKS